MQDLQGHKQPGRPVEQSVVRLDVQYDGTGFFGWQSQAGGGTVQDSIESALRILLRRDCRVTGASRTDSGVHALHQVCTFFLRPEEVSCFDRFARSLQALLPKSIGVQAVGRVDSSFHPIRSSIGKVYRYWVWRGSRRNPFFERFAWHLHGSLDERLVEQAAQVLVGKYDFRSFCATDSSVESHVRDLWHFSYQEFDGLGCFWVSGEGFLKQMVRTLVGTVVAVGQKKLGVEDIERILKAKDRRLAGQTAPALGLCLLQVLFEQRDKLWLETPTPTSPTGSVAWHLPAKPAGIQK